MNFKKKNMKLTDEMILIMKKEDLILNDKRLKIL